MPERRSLDVPDVEELLAELADGLSWPMLPDAVGAARNRLAAGERAKRREGGARWLAWAAVAVVVIIVVSMALPGPRGAVADLFGLGGVQIRQVATTVPLPPPTTLDLGPASTLDDAPLEVPFQVFVPTAVEGPPQVFTDWVAGRRVLSLVYPAQAGLPPTPGTEIGLLVTEFAGSVEPFIDKVVSANQARRFSIDGRPALWVEGAHTIFFDEGGDRVGSSQARLAANTLVVTRGNTTIRLEGAFDEATAIKLAESLVPLN